MTLKLSSLDSIGVEFTVNTSVVALQIKSIASCKTWIILS